MPTKRARSTKKSGTTRKTKTSAKKRSTKPSRPRSTPAREGVANEWFELRRSDIQGLGAFARQDIPQGMQIIEYVGEKISNAESDRRYPYDTKGRHHTFLFTLSSRTIIDAAVGGNEARFINHSCDPNCEAVIEGRRIFIYAKKDIPEGTELLYDYQYDWDPSYTMEDLEYYACRCGAPNCRGTIVKAPKAKLRELAKRRAAHGA